MLRFAVALCQVELNLKRQAQDFGCVREGESEGG